MKNDPRLSILAIFFACFLISCKREDTNVSIEQKLRQDANLISYVEKSIEFEKSMRDSIKAFTDRRFTKQFIAEYKATKTQEEKKKMSSELRDYILKLKKDNFRKNGRLSVNLYRFYVKKKKMSNEIFWKVVQEEMSKERKKLLN